MSVATAMKPRWLRWPLDSRRAVLILVAGVVSVMAVIPLLFLLWNSFKNVGPGNLFDPSLSFTLKNFSEAFRDPLILTALGDTFLFAFGAVAVSMVFAVTIAFLVERTNCHFRNVAYGLMFVPLIMPGLLKAIAWILILSPRIGVLNQIWFSLGFQKPLVDAYTIPAMWWVEGLSLTPLAFLLLGAAFRAMDPSLEEAAAASGGSKVRVFLRVTLPLAAPAFAGVALLQFVRVIDTFDVPLIMGQRQGIYVFATQIYLAVRQAVPPAYGEAFVLSMVLISFSIAGLVMYQRVLARSGKYATITGKGYRPRLIDLGRLRPLGGAFIMFFIFVSAILPFLVLLWASFLPYYQTFSREALSLFTTANYEKLFARADFLPSVKNTLILCTSVAVGAMMLGTLISWIVVRWRPKGYNLLDGLVFVPYAIPSIAVGFSYMILFLLFPNPIYGTIWILILAYLVSYLPIATRFTNAGLAQLKAELEEAAATSGASLFSVMRRIVVPLMLPSLVAGGLYIFLLAAKVTSIAAMLSTPKSMVMSYYILNLYQEGEFTVIGAFAVLMVVGLTIITIVSRRLAQRRSLASET
ncbi:MAG: iron ABC transporter permease [Dehalococcoidia bacterium]|nr:iron ABC transporter permease [Dehalococcoidia bacterium]